MEISVRRHAGRAAVALALVALLLVALLLGLAGQANAATSTSQATATLAPASSAYLDFLQALTRGTASMRTSEGRWLGYAPSLVDLSFTRGMRVEPKGLTTAAPASYDLRDYGRVTAVRNQGSLGTCWAFATYGSLESCLLPGETQNYSEDNLALQSGFWAASASTSTRYNTGGNFYMSTAYLARWAGPVDESDDAYGDAITPSGLSADKHVQEVNWLPARGSATDNENVKNAVMQYGGVYVAMHWPDSTASYFNSANASFYYNGSAGTNHAVLIVGWDDDYSRTNFATVPAADGAFLVKNSWGTSWGNAGYFWVSYYDTRFGRTDEMAIFSDTEPVTNYSGIYQYDPLGMVGYTWYNNPTGWFANVFTAQSTSSVAAVGFYTLSPNVSYEVYTGSYFTGSSLVGKTLRTSGSMPYMGYHTVALPTPVSITSGQQFVVAVKLTYTTGTTSPIAIEYPDASYSPQAGGTTGQSYISSNGSTWTDISNAFASDGITGVNVCLKAYTGSGGSTPTNYTLTTLTSGSGTVTRNPDQSTYASGSTVTLTATPASGYSFAGWSGSATGTTNPLVVTMDANKTITATFSQSSASATRYEQNNSSLAYTGSWRTSTSSSYSGNSFAYTNTLGSSVTARFTGTSVSYIARTTTSYGIAKVTLDGAVSYVDLYSSVTKYKQTVWSASGLTDGPHTLIIEHTGTRSGLSRGNTVNLDALDIVGTLTSPVTTFTLTTNVSGSGSVSREPNLPAYESGATVVLTATPGVGYVFSGWSGSATGTTNPLTVTMNANKSITATFTSTSPTTYTLSTSVTSGASTGSITVNPDLPSYTSGATVLLTAVPADGYVFMGWGGSASGTVNPLTITMNANKSVTATFAAESGGTVRYEENHAYLTYAGTWTTSSGSSLSGLMYKYAKYSGSKVTARFTGSDVSYIASVGNTWGRAKVTLDGVVTYVDLYSARTLYQKAVYTRTGLGSGVHTLVIEYTGTRNVLSYGNNVNLDALDITGTLIAP